MIHFIILFYSFSIMTGFSCLILSLLLYIKNRKKIFLYYTFFLISFTLNILINTILIYIDVNISNLLSEYEMLFKDAFYITVVSYIVTIPFFFRSLISINSDKRHFFVNIVLASLLLINLPIGHLAVSNGNYQPYQKGSTIIAYSVLFIEVLFIAIKYLLYLSKGTNQLVKKIVVVISIYIVLFLPLMIMDAFWWKFETIYNLLPDGLYFNPIAYLVWNLLSLGIAIFYFKNPKIENSIVSKGILESYSFTDKEKLVADKLKDGLSNKEIAFELTMTLASVKFHTHKIYKKMGIYSRVEFIKMITNQS